MELSLIEIWQSMGLMARFVAISLVVMGLASLAVSIERFLVLGRIDRESNIFASKARALIDANELDALIDLGKAMPRNPLARLTVVGLTTFENNRKNPGMNAAEATRRELGRKLEEYSQEARRGMSLLASVGSTAPFIGLFGTVMGIITAFQGIAASGGGGIGAVSAGIAEALIVTAVGLAVAIAAVLVFNYLSGRFDRLDMSMQHSAGELLDYLEGGAHGSGD
ncbi:MAG TPA: tolQ protein [Nannocystis exedens]|nr:tolQ protein [Nannocystis exedens]